MMKALFRALAILALAAVPVSASGEPEHPEKPEHSERPEPEIHGEFQGDAMYTLLPPDAIPALDNPTYATGDEAAAQMADDEAVLGVAIDGQAICWSTWQLDHHEIVNDVLGETPIAASW